MAAKPKDEVVFPSIKRGSVTVCIKGTTPLIMNRLSDRSARQLLCPPLKKNQAERNSTLKHDVVQEYRGSVYRSSRGDTELVLPTCALKAALMSAALDVNGASKSGVGRAVYVQGDNAPIYGIPRLLMSTVRSADMARTPDIRTRAIVEEWATVVRINFTTPMITQDNVVRLLLIAGNTIGLGDWRQEKGKGNHGCFEICEPGDPDFLRIKACGTREAQLEALAEPTPYDVSSADLLSWFLAEASRRELEHTV